MCHCKKNHPPVPDGWELIDTEKVGKKLPGDKFSESGGACWHSAFDDGKFIPRFNYIRKIEKKEKSNMDNRTENWYGLKTPVTKYGEPQSQNNHNGIFIVGYYKKPDGKIIALAFNGNGNTILDGANCFPCVDRDFPEYKEMMEHFDSFLPKKEINISFATLKELVNGISNCGILLDSVCDEDFQKWLKKYHLKIKD